MDWSSVRDKVFVSIAAAVILGGLTLLANWASHGGLVTLLGGVSQATLEEKLRQLSAPGNIDTSAVIAFDREQCPQGWERFAPATARAIVGWGDTFEVGMERDRNGQNLLPEKFRGHGGASEVILEEANVPAHKHDTQLGSDSPPYGAGPVKHAIAGASYGNYPTGLTSNPTLITDVNPKPSPVRILSPYVALSYCRKINP